MAIKHHTINLPVLIILILLSLNCTKPASTCPKMGYEFIYSKPGVMYSPGIDSFKLGSEIILKAAAPKIFFDEEKGYSVNLNTNAILGPLMVQKITEDLLIPRIGAIEDVELIAIEGSLLKDTTQFSEGQLKSFRTAYWISNADSFKLKVIIKPKSKGVFIVALNQQGNRDADCALYKYFLKVINPNQHLYFLEPLYGYIPVDDRAYCFKVY